MLDFWPDLPERGNFPPPPPQNPQNHQNHQNHTLKQQSLKQSFKIIVWKKNFEAKSLKKQFQRFRSKIPFKGPEFGHACAYTDRHAFFLCQDDCKRCAKLAGLQVTGYPNGERLGVWRKRQRKDMRCAASGATQHKSNAFFCAGRNLPLQPQPAP